jgi:hypothetical protein
VILVLAAINGCGTSEPNQDLLVDLVVRTDKPVYSLAVDEAAVVTLFNLGTRRLYVPMGEYVHIQQWGGDSWINSMPWFFIDGYTLSLKIEPGDSLVALPMDFGYVGNRAGYYRFMFYASPDPQLRTFVPEAKRVAEFQLTWE